MKTDGEINNTYYLAQDIEKDRESLKRLKKEVQALEHSIARKSAEMHRRLNEMYWKNTEDKNL